jgi:hypothetical protein
VPDLAVPYVLTTPGGTITFNSGAVDQFYIAEIQGLSGADIRAPIDDVPYGHGGIGHNFWRAGRHIVIDGHFLVTSVLCPNPAVLPLWNSMEEDLIDALESIGALTTDTGTLVWTPSGLSEHSLTVRYDVQLECPSDQGYMLRAFHFGLYAADPDWFAST